MRLPILRHFGKKGVRPDFSLSWAFENLSGGVWIPVIECLKAELVGTAESPGRVEYGELFINGRMLFGARMEHGARRMEEIKGIFI